MSSFVNTAGAQFVNTTLAQSIGKAMADSAVREHARNESLRSLDPAALSVMRAMWGATPYDGTDSRYIHARQIAEVLQRTGWTFEADQ